MSFTLSFNGHLLAIDIAERVSTCTCHCHDRSCLSCRMHGDYDHLAPFARAGLSLLFRFSHIRRIQDRWRIVKEEPNTLPTTTPSLLIIEQSAHCDWDWVATFPQYYSPGGDGHSAVQDVLNAAIACLTSTATPFLMYTRFAKWHICNGFYSRIRQTLPANFNISSGGITSADNLLTHGEAFIRNYLIGLECDHSGKPQYRSQ